MPSMTTKDIETLHRALDGMAGGRSVSSDRLIVRKLEKTFTFLLVSVEDESIDKCFFCEEVIRDASKYFTHVSCSRPHQTPLQTKHAICYNCAVPQ